MSGEGAGRRFVWYELLTTDPGGAVDFYGKVVGWKTQLLANTATPYTVWMNSGKPVGGLMRMPPEVAAQGAPPHWLGYIGVADVDATVRRAVELGGQIHHPETRPGFVASPRLPRFRPNRAG